MTATSAWKDRVAGRVDRLRTLLLGEAKDIAERVGGDRRYDEGRSRRRRVLLGASWGLFALALVVGTQPWWTGVYTWLGQERMRKESEQSLKAASVAAAPPTHASTASVGPPDPFKGWSVQDVAYWKTLKQRGAFGTLSIPKMGLDITVVKGVGKEDLKIGPGWMTNSSFPGKDGNAVISGHRTTYGAPFRHIDRLRKGDRITLTSPFRVYTYEVMDLKVLRPKEVAVLAYTEDPRLTLTACHPPFSAKYRLVAQARLVGITRRTSK